MNQRRIYILFLSTLLTLGLLIVYQLFKVHYSYMDTYQLHYWKFNEEVEIKNATVLIGRNYDRAVEAIIFPNDDKIFSYSPKLFGKIHYLFLRFPEDWYKNELHPFLEPAHFEQDLMDQVPQIREENYGDFPHFLHIPQMINQELRANLYFAKQKVFVNYVDQTSKPMLRNKDGVAQLAIDDIWQQYKEGMFQVYYDPDSRLGQVLPSWVEEHRRALKEACAYLEIDWTYGPISFFVFNNREHIQSLGLRSGMIVGEKNQIFTLADQAPGYNLAQLIAFKMSKGKEIESQLIKEGLFSLLNHSPYDPDEICRKLINKTDFQLLSENYKTCEFSYPLGASFVKFLIKDYGLKTFKSFYSQNEHKEKEAFEFYYHKTGEKLLKEWKEHLNRDPVYYPEQEEEAWTGQ